MSIAPSISSHRTQMVEIGAGIIAQGRAGRSPSRGRGSSAWRAFFRLMRPKRVKAACRPERVGMTQSNMSMPPRHGFQQIVRRAHPHEVARLGDGQVGFHRLDHGQHDLLRLAHREAADGVPRKSMSARWWADPTRSAGTAPPCRRFRTASAPSAAPRRRAWSAPPSARRGAWRGPPPHPWHGSARTRRAASGCPSRAGPGSPPPARESARNGCRPHGSGR